MYRLPVGLAVVITLIVAGCIGAQAVDVEDESEVIAAYADHIGSDIDPDDICVVTDSHFPNMALVGWFAHDRGCSGEAILVDGDWLASSGATEIALELVGWSEADAATRADLALAWAEFAIFPFRSVWGSSNEDFDRAETPAFQPPQTESDGAGGVVLTMWVAEQAGMLPESEYKFWSLNYDNDGALVRIRVLDSFIVEY